MSTVAAPDYPPRIAPRPKRPSFPTVISLLALFIALGGTSYAVIKLPAASVGTRELKRNAVTASKIRNGSIGPAELTSAASPRRGPRGPQGPAGPAGPPGSGGSGAGAPEPWRALAFEGTWTNYSSGYATGAYRKDQNGAVWLRGLLAKNGGVASSDEVIARLPVGYRPSARLLFATAVGGPDSFGRVDVLPNGDVRWMAGPAQESDYTSLETIRFWPDG